MATKIGSLLISLGLESGQFKSGLSAAEKELKSATKRIENVGKSMQGIGQSMSIAVTLPLVALGKASVDAAMESRDALAQVNASLASMGNAAERTVGQLKKLASDQMRKSLYDDDEILRSVTANLLTFGNVSGETFDRAQQAALDLSAKLGQDLQSSAIQLGKALNDPVKGVTALQRVGVSFTAQQKDQIKQMVAVGDAAGAQKLILAELERQFAGSAAAAAKANPFAQLKHSLDDFKETVGEVLLKILPPITDALKSVVDEFNSLSPGMQSFLVKAGLLAAAIGPVLYVFGGLVKITAPFTAALGLIAGQGGILAAVTSGFSGLMAVLGPILIPLAAIAAAAALIYVNWDKISPVLEKAWTTLKQTLGPPLQELISVVSSAFKEFWEGPLGEGIRGAIVLIVKLGGLWVDTFGPVVLTVIKGLIQGLTGLFKMIGDGIHLVSSLLKGEWSEAFQAAAALINRLYGGLPAFIATQVAAIYNAVKTWLVDKLNSIWKMVTDKIEMVKKAFFALYDAVVGHSYIPDMVTEIAAWMGKLDAAMVDPAQKATSKVKAAFQKLADDVRPILDELFPEAARTAEFNVKFGKLERAQKGGVITRDQSEAAKDVLQGNFLAGRPEQPDPQILQDWAAEAELALTPLKAVNDNLVAIVQNIQPIGPQFETLWDRIGIRGEEVTRDISRGLTDIVLHGRSALDVLSQLLDKLATAALDKLFSTMLTSIGLSGFAAGTNFAPGGLAIVGERGPELVNLPRGSQVIPANDTADMLKGGSPINISVAVNGAGMSDRAARQTGRQIGDAAANQIASARRFGVA